MPLALLVASGTLRMGRRAEHSRFGAGLAGPLVAGSPSSFHEAASTPTAKEIWSLGASDQPEEAAGGYFEFAMGLACSEAGTGCNLASSTGSSLCRRGSWISAFIQGQHGQRAVDRRCFEFSARRLPASVGIPLDPCLCSIG